MTFPLWVANQHFPSIFLKLGFLLTSSHVSCWLNVFRSAELEEFHPRIREEQAGAISGMLFWAPSPKITTIAEEKWGPG